MRDNPEDRECYRLVSYLDGLLMTGKILAYSHLAQSTYTKSMSVKMRNKRLGVNPGVPDYVIVTPTEVLFIEMKAQKGGVVSPHQKKWLAAIPGKKTEAVVCKGYEEAEEFLKGRV